MPIIHKLSDAYIAQIAAGETIERPCYAVKELVENAIDADARRIEIYVEGCGLDRIKVIDDGVGMDATDTQMCVLSHTTSKVSEDQSLVGIKTLGFRGEALSSIGAIANLTIQSRPSSDSSGTSVMVSNGHITHVGKVGMPKGTIVDVTQVFDHVPARKKFLKRPQTELRQIIDSVSSLALAHPAISFRMMHHDRTIVDIPSQDHIQRISEILGKTIAEHLLPVSYDDAYMHVRGYIVQPHMVTYTRHKEYLDINGRVVSDTMISHVVKDAFGDLIDPTAHPIFILSLQIPPEMIDANIHPRKEQVVFFQQDMILGVVSRAVTLSLSQAVNPSRGRGRRDQAYTQDGKGLTSSVAAYMLKDAVLPKNPLARTQVTAQSQIIQIHNAFLLLLTKGGFLLIDQHAAHERILYEQFSEAMQDSMKHMQMVSCDPILLIDCSLSDADILDTYAKELHQIGFIVKKRKKGYVLTHIPSYYRDRDVVALLKEVIGDMGQYQMSGMARSTRRMMQYLACRSAVKSGDPLSVEDASALVQQLQITPNNLTCPHGRPIYREITSEELRSWFHR